MPSAMIRDKLTSRHALPIIFRHCQRHVDSSNYCIRARIRFEETKNKSKNYILNPLSMSSALETTPLPVAEAEAGSLSTSDELAMADDADASSLTVPIVRKYCTLKWR